MLRFCRRHPERLKCKAQWQGRKPALVSRRGSRLGPPEQVPFKENHSTEGKLRARAEGDKGLTEDETAGWHHQLDGHEFEQLQELVMDREAWHAVVQGSLACCGSWGRKESDTTERLN